MIKNGLLHLHLEFQDFFLGIILLYISFASMKSFSWFFRLSGRSAFMDNDPQETEARIQAAKFDLSKLYQNVSQSASLFLKKILCSYPW